MEKTSAPAVTFNEVMAAIVGETYTVLPDGRTTVCQLTLDNGFTVEGLSACVSRENFDAELGNKYSRERAVSEAWKMLGFRLAERLARTPQEPELQQGEVGYVVEHVGFGDKVMYIEKAGEVEASGLLALVTQVNEEGTVSLVVFGPDGKTHPRQRVPLVGPRGQSPENVAYFARQIG